MYKVFKLNKDKENESAYGYAYIVLINRYVTRTREFICKWDEAIKGQKIIANDFAYEAYQYDGENIYLTDYIFEDEFNEETMGDIYSFVGEVSNLKEFKKEYLK